MSTSVSWPPIGGTTYSVPAAGEVSWATLSNYLIALANAQGTTSQKLGARIATSSPVTVISATDCLIACDLTVPGAVAVTLPAGVSGQMYAIVDGKGDAATNNITITPNGAETIRGAATYVLDKNYSGVVLVYRGTNWYIVSEFSNISSGPIPRSLLAAGTPNYVVINDGAGLLSEEAELAATRGGTGVNNSGTFTYGSNNITLTTTGATSLTLPTSGTVATLAGAEALSNKTLGASKILTTTEVQSTTGTAREVAFDIAGATDSTTTTLDFNQSANRTITFPDATTTVVGTDTTQTLTNKDLEDATVGFADQTDPTKKMKFLLAGITTATTRSLTVPDANLTIVGTATTQTLTNKSLVDSTTSFVDNVDATKVMKLELSGITTATTRTLTVPDADTTIVGIDTQQVITNKDIDGGTATDTSRVTLPKDTTVNIAALTRKQGTVLYDTTLDEPVYDNGVTVQSFSAATLVQEFVYNTDLANSNDTTSFATGSGGGQFGNFSGGIRLKRVQFSSATLATDILHLEVSQDAGVSWQDVAVSGLVTPWIIQSGTVYGMSYSPVNSTDYDVAFGNHRFANNNSFGGGGANWSDIDNDPNFVWRLRRIRA